MSKAQTLEWERRWALPAALGAFAAGILYVAGSYVTQAAGVSGTTTSQVLQEFEAESSRLLVGSILNGLSLALFALPLYYLFRAAAARTQAVRRGLVGVVLVGPLFLAGAQIFQWAALSAAADTLVNSDEGAGIPIGEYAQDLVQEQTTFGIASGLSIAGVIGFVFAVIYTALWAMRVGLLTRFVATIGMALAAVYVLPPFQGISQLGLIMWLIFLGALIVDKVPRGRPPAWDAGEAIPWPKPGEEPADRPRAQETVEGQATELVGDEANPNAERRERAKRRKRKRRR